ncbi:MAG: hypothetical protein V2A73_20710 [Pseudomonadota bacterium]
MGHRHARSTGKKKGGILVRMRSSVAEGLRGGKEGKNQGGGKDSKSSRLSNVLSVLLLLAIVLLILRVSGIVKF